MLQKSPITKESYGRKCSEFFYGLFSISVPDVTTSSNVHSQGHSVELEPAAICSSSPSISSQVLLNSWKIFSPLFNRGCVRSRTCLLFFSFYCLLYNFSFSIFASPPQFICSQRGYMQILSQEDKNCTYRYKNLAFAFTALCIFKMYGPCLNFSSVLQNQRSFPSLGNFLKPRNLARSHDVFCLLLVCLHTCEVLQCFASGNTWSIAWDSSALPNCKG